MAGRAAWVDVMPNMSGFAKLLMAGTNAAATQAGRSAGKAFSGAMGEASKTDVLKAQVESMKSALSQAEAAATQATRNIAQARDKERAADIQVEAAEARVNEQTLKYGSASSQALKATAQLTTAQSKAAKASDEVADAEKAASAAAKARSDASTALTAKENELSAVQAKQPGILDRFTSSSGKAATSTGVFGKALSSARGLVTAFGVTTAAVSLTSWVKNSLQATEDFQKQMNLLVTAGGESQSALTGVSTGIKNIAVQTGISTSQLAEGMYTMEKAQLRGADGLKVLKAAAQGATDEQVDLGVMTNALTSIMRSYNIPASQASSVTNQLVAASGEAKTTMQEFAGSLSSVLPVASAAGLSFSQVGGAVATLTSHGTSADEATQELANTIRSLQAPNQVAVKEMQQFGISSVDVAKNLGKNGLTGTISYLTETILKNMGPSGTILLNTFNQSQYAAQDASTMFDKLTGSAKSLAQGVMNGTVTLGDWRKQTKALPAEQANLAQQWETMYLKSKGFNDQLKSGSPAAQTYTDALKKIMGGATGMNTALMLSGGSAKTFQNNVAGISKVASKNGADIATWAETQNTARVQTERFNQELNVAGITLAGKFLPAITSTMRNVTNAAVSIANFTAKHQTLVKSLGVGVGVLAGLAAGYAVLRTAVLLGQFAQVAFATATGGTAVAQGSAAISAGAYATAQALGTTATTAGAAATTALGAAWRFATGPIGIAITVIGLLVGAFTLAYKHSQTFRDVVTGSLNGVKSAASAVGNWFTGPFVGFFQSGWNKVRGFFTSAVGWVQSNWKTILATLAATLVGGPLAGAFVALWNTNTAFRDKVTGLWNGFVNVVKNVGNGIINVFRFIITLTTTVLVTPWVLAWHQMQAPVTALWHNAVEPAWNGIRTVSTTVWNAIRNGVVNGWNMAVHGMATVFLWWYQSVITPTWNGIRTIFVVTWNTIKGVVVVGWTNAINGMASLFNWFNTTIITPAWNHIVTVSVNSWNTIRNGVVNTWNAAINGMGVGFNWFNSNVVQPVWGGIRNAFSAGWNWVNAHAVQPFKSGVNDIGVAFSNTANWIRTSWDKVKDAAATPVRWVVNTVYTNGIRAVWNKVAGAVGLKLNLPAAPRFAEGGINAGYAPGHDTVLAMTSPGEAWMVPEWTRAVGADNIYRWNRLARQQGPAAVRQDMLDYSRGGVVPHFDVGGIVDAVGGFIGTVTSTVKDFISDPGGAITRWIVNPVKSMLGNIGGGDWGAINARFPLMVANRLVDKAKSLWNSIGGSSASYTPSSGVSQWSSQVLQALSMLGQPASWLNTVLRRMNQESGGNPNAINLWDSNAKAGQPSQGLMQTIPSTFAAYAGPFAGRPITDPLANIYAGLNYAIHRYGSLSALDRPGGYANGGIIPSKLYDTGGVLPVGATLVENHTGSPELVLNHSQQDLLFGNRGSGDDTPISKTGRPIVNQTINVTNTGVVNPYSSGTILGRSAAAAARPSLQGVG